MKKIAYTSLLALGIMLTAYTASSPAFYSFKLKDIDGNEFSFNELKGKKVMIVNVASKCGYTPQYEALQAMYEKYSSKGFTIIAFPANNFANQEPGSNADIKAFCSSNYNVSFPIMEKISVNGEDIHPIYRWLTSKELNGKMDTEVKWNFQKYLIDEKGQLWDVAYSREKPDSERIINWIEGK